MYDAAAIESEDNDYTVARVRRGKRCTDQNVRGQVGSNLGTPRLVDSRCGAHRADLYVSTAHPMHTLLRHNTLATPTQS